MRMDVLLARDSRAVRRRDDGDGRHLRCIGRDRRRNAESAAGVRSDVYADHRAAIGGAGSRRRWSTASRSSAAGCLLRNCRLWACFASSGGIGLRIFGPGFEAGAMWVALLAIAHATNSFVGLAETVIMIQRPMLNLINSGATVVLQFGASLLLIPCVRRDRRRARHGARVCDARRAPLPASCGSSSAGTGRGVRSPGRRLAFAIAFAIALPLRLLIAGWQGELVAGLTFLAAYVACVESSSDSRRPIASCLRQLWAGRRRKRHLPEDDAA